MTSLAGGRRSDKAGINRQSGDGAFILAEAELEGSGGVRNAEFFRTKGHKITALEVYFGSPARGQAK